jgi:hypothetical protein
MKSIQIALLLISTVILLGSAVEAVGAEVYPKRPITRIFGTSQGNVGDCWAEADIAALESAFSERGYDIALSLYYRHAFNWSAADPNEIKKKQGINKLDYSDQDRKAFATFGPIIPQYMWPEDGEGINTYRTGTRPHVSEAAVIDQDFIPANRFGFTEFTTVYVSGYSNSGSLSLLKANIDARNAVTLNIHSALFQPMNFDLFNWNKTTGLLDSKYSLSLLKAAIARESADGNFTNTIDHAVAVVGYDDSLYADQGYPMPGALIVRNSWNDLAEIMAARYDSAIEDKTLADLRKMRLKISSSNLPGYYAIPYQYIMDIISQNPTAMFFRTKNLDYAGFAAQYQKLEKRYTTIIAPFSCSSALESAFSPAKRAMRDVKQVRRDLELIRDNKTPVAIKKQLKSEIKNIINREASPKLLAPVDASKFSYAKIARNSFRGEDRVSDFYSGKYNTYYCNEMNPKIWPDNAIAEQPEFKEAISAISEDPNSPSSWLRYFMALPL